MVVITIGEMIYAPKEQTIVASLAPEHMRGRYMAIRNLSWIIPVSFGPLGAGLIMDNLDPRLLWFIVSFIGMLAVLGFIYLHFKYGKKLEDKFNGGTVETKEEEKATAV